MKQDKVVGSLGGLLGGTATDGASAGLACVISIIDVAVSCASLGSRICKDKMKSIRTLRPCHLA